ncbi:MAG: MFS transporter, partial [Nitrospinota bacterium]
MRYRTLFVAWYLWFLVFSLRVAISPVLPLLEDELSLTHAQAGRLFTFLHTGYILILLAAGLIVSRWGSRRTLLFIFAAMALLSLAIRFSGGAGELSVLLFLLGLATGLLLPAVVPVLTATYSRAAWGRTFGVFDTAVGIALFGMPFLAMAVLTFGTWREMFLILSALCWLAVSLVFLVIKRDVGVSGSGRRADYRSLLRNRDLLVIGFLFIFMTTASQGIYAIVPIYMVKGRGIDIQLTNTVFGLSRLPAILGALGGGYMLDRLGPRR